MNDFLLIFCITVSILPHFRENVLPFLAYLKEIT